MTNQPSTLPSSELAVPSFPTPNSELRTPNSELPTPATLTAAAAANLIQSGDIVHSFTDLWFPRRIKQALGSWGSHDAIIVRPENELCIGESIHPRATCTPLAEYDAKIARGLTQAIVLRPTGSTPAQGSLAAAWWLQNVLGKPYDWASFPRLMLKCLVGDRCQWPAGWEWAWYCTEGVRDAWRNGPGLDPWQKNNPTPRTTEKRFVSGALSFVWASHPCKILYALRTTVNRQPQHNLEDAPVAQERITPCEPQASSSR